MDSVDGQRIEELGSANLFICKNGVIKTPKLSGSILDGVTRNSVCRIAKDVLSIKVEETDIHLDELLEADEIFCTGTAVVLAPVGKVTHQDKVYHFSNGKIGPITKKCKEDLRYTNSQSLDLLLLLHLISLLVLQTI